VLVNEFEQADSETQAQISALINAVQEKGHGSPSSSPRRRP